MLQALTLSATMHELAFAIGYIGIDDARAASWETHTKDYDTFPSLRQRTAAVRATLLALGMKGEGLEEELDRLERNYRFLCMAKHANPLLQKNWGAREHNQSLSLFHGPFLGRHTTRQAKQILYAATELIWYACGVAFFAWQDTSARPARRRCLRHIRRLEQLRWEARFYPGKPPQRAG
jgi:hypothetical protein